MKFKRNSIIGKALNSAKKGHVVKIRLGTLEGLRIQDINEIIDKLKALWLKYPDQRLGQLLENYVFDLDFIFHQDDEVTLSIINRKIKGKKCK